MMRLDRRRKLFAIIILLCIIPFMKFGSRSVPAKGFSDNVSNPSIVSPSGKESSGEQSSAKNQLRMEAYAKLPIRFEPNHGQTDPAVKFLSRGDGYNVFLTSTEAVLSLRKPSTGSKALSPTTRQLRMKLVGANPAPQIQGDQTLEGMSHYLIGSDPKKWKKNIPTYAKVDYKNVYPGVDLIYYGNQRQLEHDFVVAPGADPKVIRVAFSGAEKLEINKEGDLVLYLSGQEVRFNKPLIYQEVNGFRQPISGGYLLKSRNQVGFEAAAYDRTKPLIIDPVLIYSTYLGGSGEDSSKGIAVDQDGNVYVTGYTYSTDFPTVNARQPGFGGGYSDAYVAKLNPAGSALVYSTYLGGSVDDYGYAIAVDRDGSAYVTGITSSANFPTVNARQPAIAGGLDAFVAKLSPTGSNLVYSTFLGGNSEDRGNGIAIDADGSAYVTGETNSINFPTVNALQPALAGGRDAFVAKFDPSGRSLVYSTFLGGSRDDVGNGIAVDAGGNVYVAGSTSSFDFHTANPLQPALAGSKDCIGEGVPCPDAFVAKLNAAGSALIYSTYLGGNDWDFGNAIAVDTSGNAYVTGAGSLDFPTVNQIPMHYNSLYKSNDGGQSWSANSLKDYEVRVLAIDHTNPSVVYAGTTYAGLAGGLFKSTDNGQTWTLLNSAPAITSLVIDPVNSSTLYAGGDGVYKSTDGGLSWVKLPSPSIGGSGVLTLAFDSQIPPTLYAGGEGVAKSVNGGQDWTVAYPMNAPLRVNAIAVDPMNPLIVYAGISVEHSDVGLVKSLDGGATWSQTLRTGPVYSLAIDPANPSTVYAGGGYVFKTTDGGSTWLAKNIGLAANAKVLAIDPANPSILYAAGDGGVFKTTDGGETWTARNQGLGEGLGPPSVLTLAINPTDSSIYAGIPISGLGAFLTKLNSTGSALVYSTRLPGEPHAIAVDGQRSAYIAGLIYSYSLPTEDGLQPNRFGNGGGFLDAYIAKVNPAGGALEFLTYLVGSGDHDYANGIAVDELHNVYVTGNTDSNDFPLVSPLQSSNPGAGAFVSKVSPAGTMSTTTTTTISTTTTTYPPPKANSLSPNFVSSAPSAAQTFTAIVSDPYGYLNISKATLLISGPMRSERLDYNAETNKFTLSGASGDCPGQATLSDGYLALDCRSINIYPIYGGPEYGYGNALSITFTLTPSGLSGGPYQMILSVMNIFGGVDSKTAGVWTVNRPPVAGTVSPMNSSTAVNTTQTFNVDFSDPDGFQNIAAVNFYLSGNGGEHYEWLHYVAAPNLFILAGSNDTCSPGQAKAITNGYLTLDCATSNSAGSGTTLRITLRVTPQTRSAGINYNIFTTASDHAGGAANPILAGRWQVQ